MKTYAAAILLGIAIAPVLGAMIYGSFLGNPLMIFAPAVLPIAYIIEVIPFLVFGLLGCFIHHNYIKRGKRIRAGGIVAYGIMMGTLCALVPLLVCVEDGHWEFNRGINSFLATGAITGLLCAFMGIQIINRMKGSANDCAEDF